MRQVKIALLGAGTVGAGFIRLLGQHQAKLMAGGTQVELSAILVHDAGKSRPHWIPSNLLTTNPGDLLRRADIVVELMGGVQDPLPLVITALSRGLPLITANKAMLAEAWQELKAHAENGRVYYEASVMAGTPVIGPLAGTLRANHPQELHAILNGTTNYILSRVEEGLPYDQALSEAQAKGFAEADPSLDVNGFDAAHKLTVLARLVVNADFSWEEVKANTSGIVGVTAKQLESARMAGYRLRLLGSLFAEDGRWKPRVALVPIPLSHPLAQADYAKNALWYRGDAVGEIFISGAGAGSSATASAVLGDLYRYLAGDPGPKPLPLPAVATGNPHLKLEPIQPGGVA